MRRGRVKGAGRLLAAPPTRARAEDGEELCILGKVCGLGELL